jgi:DNA-binding MarR family transcriptional regulator
MMRDYFDIAPHQKQGQTMPTTTNRDSGGAMLDLYDHPGHLLRRAQQISVSIFYDEMGDELTPVQYAILSRLASRPGIDQVSLAGLAAVDTSTGATVCARLEEKGLLDRKVIPHNRRQRALTITTEGARMLGALELGAQRLRERLLAPLSAQEQELFMGLLAKLVNENNEQSRAPLAMQALRASPGNGQNKECAIPRLLPLVEDEKLRQESDLD